MTSITFDTYSHIKDLREKGFSEAQAVSVVNMIKESQEMSITSLATKADLFELKADIIKWVVGMGFAQVALILTVFKLLVH